MGKTTRTWLISSMLCLSAAAKAAPDPFVPLTGVRDSYPHLSPDGRQLVFHSNRSGRQAIWIASADGKNPRILFDQPNLGQDPGTPVWSPDGRSIAFAMRPAGSQDQNESEIYLMGPDGRGVRRLTAAAGDDSHPHWSADGKRIFFNSARATPDLKAEWGRQWIDVYSMATDGSDIRRHTDCRSVCTYPVPSPDGRSVAYRRIIQGLGQNWDLSPAMRNSEVMVARLDGAGEANVSRSPAFDGWPMWTPNGQWLVFASNRDKLAYAAQIYAVRADGTGLRRLTDGPWSRAQPSFSSDGRQLFVYQSLENADVEVGYVARIAVTLPD